MGALIGEGIDVFDVDAAAMAAAAAATTAADEASKDAVDAATVTMGDCNGVVPTGALVGVDDGAAVDADVIVEDRERMLVLDGDEDKTEAETMGSSVMACDDVEDAFIAFLNGCGELKALERLCMLDVKLLGVAASALSSFSVPICDSPRLPIMLSQSSVKFCILLSSEMVAVAGMTSMSATASSPSSSVVTGKSSSCVYAPSSTMSVVEGTSPLSLFVRARSVSFGAPS